MMTYDKCINLEASAPLHILPRGPTTNHKDHQNVQQEHNNVHLAGLIPLYNVNGDSMTITSRTTLVGGSAPIYPATALRISVRSPELYGVDGATAVAATATAAVVLQCGITTPALFCLAHNLQFLLGTNCLYRMALW